MPARLTSGTRPRVSRERRRREAWGRRRRRRSSRGSGRGPARRAPRALRSAVTARRDRPRPRRVVSAICANAERRSQELVAAQRARVAARGVAARASVRASGACRGGPTRTHESCCGRAPSLKVVVVSISLKTVQAYSRARPRTGGGLCSTVTVRLAVAETRTRQQQQILRVPHSRRETTVEFTWFQHRSAQLSFTDIDVAHRLNAT